MSSSLDGASLDREEEKLGRNFKGSQWVPFSLHIGAAHTVLLFISTTENMVFFPFIQGKHFSSVRFPYCRSYASLELHMSVEIRNTILKHDFHVLMLCIKCMGFHMHTAFPQRAVAWGQVPSEHLVSLRYLLTRDCSYLGDKGRKMGPLGSHKEPR